MLWVAFFILIPLTGCNKKQLIQAQIVDELNKPIAGALLYYEVYDIKGVYDFVYAVADNKGEAPSKNSRKLVTEWHSGSRIALAAFAKGKKPTVLYDQLGNISPTGMVITLYNLSDSKLKWQPRIAKLSFPFEDNPKLYKKAELLENKPIRNAFINAYQPLIDGEVTMFEYEKEKINAINKLIKDSSK